MKRSKGGGEGGRVCPRTCAVLAALLERNLMLADLNTGQECEARYRALLLGLGRAFGVGGEKEAEFAKTLRL
jgi:hypothetical protein